MSDLAWAVKNGDLDQVKEMVEGKVGLAGNALDDVSHHTFPAAGGWYKHADRWQAPPALCQWLWTARGPQVSLSEGDNIFTHLYLRIVNRISGSPVEFCRQAWHLPPPGGHLGGPHQLCTVPAREGEQDIEIIKMLTFSVWWVNVLQICYRQETQLFQTYN